MRSQFAAWGIALATMGCAHGQPEEAFSQENADAISAKCGGPPSWLTVWSDGEVMFQPSVDADYDVAACVLREVKAAGVKRFGFIGNEAIPPAN